MSYICIKMKCKHKYCRNSVEKNRLECGTCHTRGVRERNPMRYCYQNLKSNAKRRGKKFSLTFDQFKKFALEHKLVMGQGRSRNSWTVDRINNTLGYTPNNIQPLTRAQNASKRTRTLNYDWKTQYGRYTPLPSEALQPTPF